MFPATAFDRLDAFDGWEWENSAPSFGFPRLALDRLRSRPSRKGSHVVRSHLIKMFDRIYELFLAADGSACHHSARTRIARSREYPEEPPLDAAPIILE